MSRLYVAMYQPEEGNCEHWNLYLEAEEKLYEVTGEHPDFTLSVTTGNPGLNPQHRRSIFVWDINEDDLPGFMEAVVTIKPNNEVAYWNCQDYVIEILEKLEEECIVDGDDEAYVAAIKRIKRHFGPM